MEEKIEVQAETKEEVTPKETPKKVTRAKKPVIYKCILKEGRTTAEVSKGVFKAVNAGDVIEVTPDLKPSALFEKVK